MPSPLAPLRPRPRTRRPWWFWRTAFLGVGALLVIGACGSSGETDTATAVTDSVTAPPTESSTTTDPAGDTDEDDGTPRASSTKPEVVVGTGEPPDELIVEDLAVGAGREAAVGDFLEMHYVGVRYDDGGQFDASWDRGQTFELVLGIGQVIPGWDEGIVGMRVGGRRQLTIPPDMAYGESGAGADIPPDSTLVFVVDLVEATAPIEVANAPEPVTGLEIEVLSQGTGAEIGAGTTVRLLYTAVHQPTGEVFDSSWRTGRAAAFVVAAEPSQAIPAWDQGLIGRRVGDHIRMVIPPELGLGGGGGPIGPDDTIVTELVILSAAG